MPSTYSNLKIQLMATGENNTTWGDVTNVNLGTALEEAIVGSADVTFASGNVTLTLTDTNATQTARNMRLRCTGTTGGARDLIVPAIEKPYIVQNDCADAITVKNSTGTGIAVPAGKTMWVYNNGTNVVDAVTHLSSLTLGTDLSVADGGTGASTFTANGLLYGNGASALQVTAAGTTGQVLVGNTGSAPSWAALSSSAVTSFSAGTTGLTPSTGTQGAITLGGTLNVANGGTGVTTSTGTGSVVLSSSPTLVTPTLGAASATSIATALGSAAAPSHTFTGDTNTGIYSPAADTLAFVEGGVEAMRIDSSGNVGIGTSSPSSYGKLTVNGSVILGAPSGRNTAATNYIGTWTTGDPADDTRANIGFTTVAGAASSSSFITFATNNYGVSSGERMRIDSSGNVGIGTSTATARLRVSAGAVVNAPVLGNATNYPAFFSNSDPAYGLGIGTNASDGHVWLQAQRADTTTTPYNITLNEAGGNVGIGTSSPGAKLDVAGTNGNVQINAAGDQVSYTFNGFNYLTASGAAATLQIQASGASGVLTFATAGSERFRITSTGAITSSNLADAVGYKGIPQNAQTASYTLALSDMGKHISITTGGVVIPANSSVAFPVGSTIVIYNNSGSTQTISITTDTLRQAGTTNTGTRTLAVYGVATCIKVASTTWVVSGNVS